jgi:hypothetical protein
MEVATRCLISGIRLLAYSVVSTPFLPNGSRHLIIPEGIHVYLCDGQHRREFQHLFFLTEVATQINDLVKGVILVFQHLFFLTEVATKWAVSVFI